MRQPDADGGSSPYVHFLTHMSAREAELISAFVCGDVTTGRGIDQALPYSETRSCMSHVSAPHASTCGLPSASTARMRTAMRHPMAPRAQRARRSVDVVCATV